MSKKSHSTRETARETDDGMPHAAASHVVPAGPRIRRDAILERLFRDDAPPIVLLQAPAGHGKSTVLRQVRDECMAKGVRCGWLPLDDSDNDASHHAAHLQRMLRQVLTPSKAAKSESARARVDRQERADWIVELLEKEASSIALFLDEFEVLSDKSVLAFWKDFLLKLPAHVRVFIAARSSPDVGIPRLTVSDRLLALSARDLCFSEAEVRSFFRSTETTAASDKDIRAIHERTEGWPAAIQLFRLGVSRMSPVEVLRGLEQYRPQGLADYLTECVLDGLSPDVRAFLERTCILNRLNAQICNALTGRSDSKAILMRLEKQGLFVSAIDDGSGWFRYHTLFATQLREQLLTESPERFRQLHQEAAQWFLRAAIPGDAIHHAVAANDLGFAADILQAWSERLVADGELSIADRWYECLPLAEIQARPVLRRRLAWAMVFLRQRGKVTRILDDGDVADDGRVPIDEVPVRSMGAICADQMDRAFQIISQVDYRNVDLDRFTSFELGAAANLDAFAKLIIGDFRGAERALAIAKAYNEKGQAFFSAGYTASVHGLSLLLKGRTADAIEHLNAALIEQRRALDLPFATAPLACCHLWCLYESNRLDEVLATFANYREMVLGCAIPDLFAVGVLSALRACRALRRDDGYYALLAEAEVIAAHSGWPRIVRVLQSERSMSGSRPATPRSQTDGGAPPDLDRAWLTFVDLFTLDRLAMVRQAIRDERYAEAGASLDALLGLRPDCALLNMRLGFCKAQLLEARGLRNPAARQFAASVRLACDGGFLRSAIEEAREQPELMAHFVHSLQAQPDSPLLGFVTTLNESGAVPRSIDVDPPAQIDLDQLSDREREIAGYLSQRMSNQEIANSANISENTVKFHLKKIFGKLGVSKRAEAYSVLIKRLRRSD